MSFQDVRFPEGVSYFAQGGPGWSTFIGTGASGSEYRVSRWALPRGRWDVSFGIRSFANLIEVRDHYMSMRGSLHGFRFKDWSDFSSEAGDRDLGQGGADPTMLDQLIGTGDGTNQTFQLRKNYQVGLDLVERPIVKPVSGTILIAVNGISTTAFSIDDTTGIVTMNTAPTLSHDVTAGFEFDVPVRFGEVVDEAFVLSVDAFDTGSIPQIELIEEPGTGDTTQIFYYGGSKNHGQISVDTTISLTQGRLHVADPTAASVSMVLQDPSEMPQGGPLFVVHNDSGTQTLGLKIAGAGSAFFTIPINEARQVWQGFDSTGVAAYFVI